MSDHPAADFKPTHPFDTEAMAKLTASAARQAGYTQLSVQRTIVQTLFHSRGDTPVSAYNYLLALYTAMGEDEPEQTEAEIAAHAAGKMFDLINEVREKTGDDRLPEKLRERLVPFAVGDVAEERRA